LVTAVLLWLAAALIDRPTEVIIDNIGNHLRFNVADTELILPGAMFSVERITIHAADSIARPGAVVLEIDHDGTMERLPR